MFVPISVTPHIPQNVQKEFDELYCPLPELFLTFCGEEICCLVFLPAGGDLSVKEYVPAEGLL